MLQPYLAARIGCPVLFLHGGTSKKQRDAMVARFQEVDVAGTVPAVAEGGRNRAEPDRGEPCHPRGPAGGTRRGGQATDRAFRIGQRRDVQVRKFVCVGTLEEKIDAMIEQKRALAEQTSAPARAGSTDLSTAALREVLTLSPEAVTA